MENLISFAGFCVLALIAWTLSRSRKDIKWKTIAGGVFLQFFFAAFVFLFPPSRDLFLKLSNLFSSLLECSREGIVFVLGSLGAANSPSGFILLFQALPFVIIFAALMSLLFYLGVIPFIIKLFARFISKFMSNSGAETLCASANIFCGIESETAVAPYIKNMTRSELFLILTAGMSTIASTVLAAYVSMLSHVFPAIAGHLISASVISIPAAFVIAKLMEPETECPETSDVKTCELHLEDVPKNWLEAILNGANSGMKLLAGIAGTLIAVIGILGMLKGICLAATGNPHLIEEMLSFVFRPVALLIGIAPSEAAAIGKLLGERLIMTEVASYIDLAAFAKNGGSPRSILIASYALCGFAHVASMAIFTGGTAALAPEKTQLLCRIAPKALLAATITTLMTGALAGIFYWGQEGIMR